jgi:hypothetical protein
MKPGREAPEATLDKSNDVGNAVCMLIALSFRLFYCPPATGGSNGVNASL